MFHVVGAQSLYNIKTLARASVLILHRLRAPTTTEGQECSAVMFCQYYLFTEAIEQKSQGEWNIGMVETYSPDYAFDMNSWSVLSGWERVNDDESYRY